MDRSGRARQAIWHANRDLQCQNSPVQFPDRSPTSRASWASAAALRISAALPAELILAVIETAMPHSILEAAGGLGDGARLVIGLAFPAAADAYIVLISRATSAALDRAFRKG